MAGCIFDGASPTTNAHIFRAAWLRNLFATADVFRHVHVRHEPGHGFTREWRKEPDFKVNCACDGCNSGWMEARDLAAEEVFTTAVARGNSVKLMNPADKFTVARWCVLIAILFDQGQAEPRLDGAFHKTFYDGSIPDDVGVWLGSLVPDDTSPDAYASMLVSYR